MSDGTLQTLDVTMLEDVGTGANQLIQLDSNAKIPACSAAAVTNLPSITKSSSDPVITTNPSGGVGTVYQNTTSGEMYVCTDATAGANVWTNVGGGTGDVEPWSYPGLTYGYMHGGGSPSNTANIEKFNMQSDSNGASVGNLTAARAYVSHGNASETHGYCAGGASDIIDKYSFSSDGNASDVGNLLNGNHGTPCGTASTTHCYVAGGSVDSPSVNIIQKWSVSTDQNSTDVGDLTRSHREMAGASSATFGYAAGGYSNIDVIDKYSFSADANATDVGNLTDGRTGRISSSSATHGFKASGESPGVTNVIDKWTFSADANATDVGDLTATQYGDGGGASSVTAGYAMSGTHLLTKMEKWSHVTDGNATDVCDPATGRNHCGGNHV